MQAQGIPQEDGAVVICHLMQGSNATFVGRVSVVPVLVVKPPVVTGEENA
jgi:nucleotide-binding universal stress UspA family protein